MYMCNLCVCICIVMDKYNVCTKMRTGTHKLRSSFLCKLNRCLASLQWQCLEIWLHKYTTQNRVIIVISTYHILLFFLFWIVFVFPFHFFVTVPNSGLTQAWTLMKTVYLTGSAEPFLGSIAALVLTYTFFSSKCFFSHHFKHFNETAKKLCRCSVYTVLSLHWRYITTYTCLPSSIFK